MHALFFSAEPTHLHMHGSHEPMPEGQASRVEAGHNCSVKLGEWQVPGLHGFAQVRMDKHAFGPVMALTRVKQRGSLCRKPKVKTIHSQTLHPLPAQLISPICCLDVHL